MSDILKEQYREHFLNITAELYPSIICPKCPTAEGNLPPHIVEKLGIGVHCITHGMVMENQEDGTLMCKNENCKLFGIKFKLPSIELERIDDKPEHATDGPDKHFRILPDGSREEISELEYVKLGEKSISRKHSTLRQAILRGVKNCEKGLSPVDVLEHLKVLSDEMHDKTIEEVKAIGIREQEAFGDWI